MLTPRTTRGNWRKKKKNGVQPEIDRDSCPIVTSTITAVLVAPLIAEIDGDVTERRDLRLRTPNELTPVYKARRMNVRCQFCV